MTFVNSIAVLGAMALDAVSQDYLEDLRYLVNMTDSVVPVETNISDIEIREALVPETNVVRVRRTHRQAMPVQVRAVPIAIPTQVEPIAHRTRRRLIARRGPRSKKNMIIVKGNPTWTFVSEEIDVKMSEILDTLPNVSIHFFDNMVADSSADVIVINNISDDNIVRATEFFK